MTPEEILSQLPAQTREKIRSARISASPTSSLGESQLVECEGSYWLFTRDSMLSPFAMHTLQQKPKLSAESMGNFLVMSGPQEIKIKVSLFEVDEISVFLTGTSAASSGPANLPAPPTSGLFGGGHSVSIADASRVGSSTVLETPRPSEAPAAGAPSTLTSEEAEELQESLEEDVVKRIEENDLDGAKLRLRELCKLPLDDTDELASYALGILSIDLYLEGKLRDAFFIAGDYDSFYLDFQDAWMLFLAKKLEAAGEKRLAAAAYFVPMEALEAKRVLQDEELDEETLRPLIYQEAIVFLQDYLRSHPNEHLVMSYLASILADEEKHEELLEVAKKMISLAPHQKNGYQKAVEATLEMKQFDTALAFAKDALAKNPDAAWANSLQGEVLDEKGDTSASRRSFEEALRRNPKDFTALHGLQKVLRSQQDHQALATLLEGSVEHLSYNKKEIYEELAQLYAGPLRNAAKAREFRVKASETPSLIAPEKGGSSVWFWVAMIGGAIYWFILR